MKIAICDDEKLCRDLILEYLYKFKQKLYDFEITEFCCGEDLINFLKNDNFFDAIFIDVEMKHLNGIETAHIIREIDKNVIISFLTSYKQYVFNSFKVSAFDYLIKPISEEEFNKLMDRILEKYKNDHFVLNVKWKDEISQIEIKNILYIEGYRRHLFYQTHQEKFQSLGKLNDIEIQLRKYGLIRCHQGFLVNMNYIKTIEDKNIVLVDGTKIEMSFRKKSECLRIFNKYIAEISL
jgi:DNA-binding LytR/AlgR family response regulator